MKFGTVCEMSAYYWQVEAEIDYDNNMTMNWTKERNYLSENGGILK